MALTRLRTGGIAANAVVAAAIAPGAVDITDVADGAITTNKLAANAITSAKIEANAITSAQISANAVTSTQLASTLDLTGKTVTLPAGVGGKVLQVVSVTKTDTYSVSLATATTDTTDAISASITPTSASSKILLIASLQVSLNGTNARAAVILHRGGSVLTGYTGDAAGNRSRVSMHNRISGANATEGFTGLFLDSPNTTNATTYSFRLRHSVGSTITMLLNAPFDDDDASYSMRPASTITLMEIAA